MKIALTVLFSLFAAYSLVGATDNEKTNTKNSMYGFLISTLAILLINTI